MTPLHRHQLAHLTACAWRRLVAEAPDAVAADCLRHWADRHLPAVVTRQPPGDDDLLALAIAAPLRWERRRLGFRAARAEVAWFDEFPRLERIAERLAPDARAEGLRLCRALAACGATARVYGSHGWRAVSGLGTLRPGSDLDLWIAVSDAGQADAVAALLGRPWPALPRLDGELHLPDGAAVAWREWADWRAGRVRALLVKTLTDCRLRWSAEPQGVPA